METNILIIGAGFAGAATAYHLKRRGEKEVILLEMEAVAGVHSSGRNAAMIRAEISDPDIRRLAMESRPILAAGALAAYERNGAFLMGQGDEEVERHFPLARGRGRWVPEEGVIDVNALLQAYLKGQDVRYDTEVLSWQRVGSEMLLSTTNGRFRARLVVNAAGSWAGPLGRLPLTPTKRHIFVSTPMERIDAHWPFVWDEKVGLYFRPESGGLLLSPCDQTPCEPGDYREEEEKLEELAQKVSTHQPGLGDIEISNRWTGHRTFSPDHKFVIGFDPRESGLFHVAALAGHGVTASPAIGRLAAGLLMGDWKAANPFDPARLAL